MNASRKAADTVEIFIVGDIDSRSNVWILGGLNRFDIRWIIQYFGCDIYVRDVLARKDARYFKKTIERN